MSLRYDSPWTTIRFQTRIVSQGLDSVDAMLRGRYAQERFTIWVWKRIRDLYPK